MISNISQIDVDDLKNLPCSLKPDNNSRLYTAILEIVWPYSLFKSLLGEPSDSNPIIKVVFENMNWLLLEIRFESNRFADENELCLTTSIACNIQMDEIFSASKKINSNGIKKIVDSMLVNLYYESCKAHVMHDLEAKQIYEERHMQ